MARLFGTDGIRGVANVDLKPTLAYALGRAVAHRLVGSRRGDRGRPGHPPLGRHVRGGHRRRRDEPRASTSTSSVSSRRRPSPSSRGSGPFAAGIMVSASHNPAADNGLKVLDGDGLKLDDSIEDELERLIWRTEELPGVPNDELGRMIDASARLDDYLAHRLALAESIDAARPAARARRGERLGLGGRAARSWRRPAPRSRSSTPSRTASTSTSTRARPRPRRWPRRSSRPAPMPASRSTATRTGSSRSMPADGSSTATRCSASSPSTGSAATRCRAAGWSSRSSRTAGSRRSSRRPAARSSGRPSATSTSSRGCRCRARSSAARRAATSSSSSTRRRATAS